MFSMLDLAIYHVESIRNEKKYVNFMEFDDLAALIKRE